MVCELSDDDDGSSTDKPVSYNDLEVEDYPEDPVDSVDDSSTNLDRRPFEGRDVPIELSTVDEEKIETEQGGDGQLKNIIQEVQQEAARLNGHATKVDVNGTFLLFICLFM